MIGQSLPFVAQTAHVSSLAIVGAPGEDKRRGPNPPNHGAEVGERTVIRELATIHGGFTDRTRIGADCYVMAHSHVGHDSQLQDGVTLATGATLGGYTWVGEGANVGLLAVTHQQVAVGAYAMIGAGAVVLEDVPPFQTWVGVPARHVGWNKIGMRRAGFSEEAIDRICAGGETTYHDEWRRHAGRRGR